MSLSLSHRLGRMTGRDPYEKHRTSTPLELLFDLTFVVAFSQVSSQAAHYLELGDVTTAAIGFPTTVFAAVLAWINYSWLASAYDNDDIFFRVATLIEMVGVLVFALGVPAVFTSIAGGDGIDLAVTVAGYVVMRLAAVAVWLRAARHDPGRRRTALTYAVAIAAVQLLWIGMAVIHLPLPVMVTIFAVLAVIELTIPLYAERLTGGTPWHGHHIAERYSLLAIITLGEVVLGTILAISAVVDEEGWSLEAALVAFGGTALVFGLWWTYFIMPSGRILHAHRERGFVWGYGHFLIFGSLVGVGTGLHVSAQVISQHAEVDASFALLCVAIPVLVFELTVFTLYAILLREFDPFHIWLLIGAIALLAVAVAAVSAGATIGVALLIVAASPALIVVGYEMVGYRHQAAALERNGV